VLVRFPGGKKVVAEYKGFRIETDQPKTAGGGGSAPSPFDLFLASLATCSGYYVLSFCEKREIPASDITLSLSAKRDAETHRIERIELAVDLPATFPDKYVDACVAAASQCAVKKLLVNPPEITISASKPA
jgi:putative redox protein